MLFNINWNIEETENQSELCHQLTDAKQVSTSGLSVTIYQAESNELLDFDEEDFPYEELSRIELLETPLHSGGTGSPTEGATTTLNHTDSRQHYLAVGTSNKESCLSAIHTRTTVANCSSENCEDVISSHCESGISDTDTNSDSATFSAECHDGVANRNSKLGYPVTNTCNNLVNCSKEYHTDVIITRTRDPGTLLTNISPNFAGYTGNYHSGVMNSQRYSHTSANVSSFGMSKNISHRETECSDAKTSPTIVNYRQEYPATNNNDTRQNVNSVVYQNNGQSITSSTSTVEDKAKNLNLYKPVYGPSRTPTVPSKRCNTTGGIASSVASDFANSNSYSSSNKSDTIRNKLSQFPKIHNSSSGNSFGNEMQYSANSCITNSENVDNMAFHPAKRHKLCEDVERSTVQSTDAIISGNDQHDTITCRTTKTRAVAVVEPISHYSQPNDSVKKMKVDASVVNLTNKLQIRNSNWTVSALISTGVTTYEVDFSSEVLDEILGFTVEELKQQKIECQSNPLLKDSVNEMLQAAQKKLRTLNCKMVLDMSSEDKPRVVQIGDAELSSSP